jgi:hypothetical protein
MAVYMGLVKTGTRPTSLGIRCLSVWEPVSRVLGKNKQQQVWLQRSTGTKQQAEAKRRTPAIMTEFAKVLQDAEELLAERPLRTTLSDQEITRLSEWHYANVLAADEFTTEGTAEDEALVRSIADQAQTK